MFATSPDDNAASGLAGLFVGGQKDPKDETGKDAAMLIGSILTILFMTLTILFLRKVLWMSDDGYSSLDLGWKVWGILLFVIAILYWVASVVSLIYSSVVLSNTIEANKPPRQIDCQTHPPPPPPPPPAMSSSSAAHY